LCGMGGWQLLLLIITFLVSFCFKFEAVGMLGVVFQTTISCFDSFHVNITSRYYLFVNTSHLQWRFVSGTAINCTLTYITNKNCVFVFAIGRWNSITCGILQGPLPLSQDRQCTYNITWRVRITILAIEKP